MKEINPLRGDMTVKVGDTVYLSYTRHGSVGISSNVSISDEMILEKISEHCDYKNKQVEGTTGGDEASITLVFKAKAKGVCEVIERKMFRGNLEQEINTKITVE